MKYSWIPLLSSLLLTACIKDDIVFDTVDPVLRINQLADTIALDETFQFNAIYLNNIGVEEEADMQWLSSAPDVISIDDNGLALALQTGSAIISAQYDNGIDILEDAIEVHTGEETVVATSERSGTIQTTSSYTLSGDFVITAAGPDINLSIAANYVASTSLPGLYIYLSNNPNTIANAYEIGAVQVFSGAHSYTIPGVDINDYNYLVYFCKPFNVKVGDGEIL